MEAEFLVGRHLADRVRTICMEREVDCAVAFWGPTVRATLFPRWNEGGVRIVCDIAMGCNSQVALTNLGAPENARLRVHDGLHTKMYLSASGAVVGSCNASLNGLGRDSVDPRNLEVGTFLPAGSKAWRDAKKWFDDLFANGSVGLDARQLARAPAIARDPGPRIGPEGRRSGSLLDLVRSYPESFHDTLLLGEWEGLEPDEVDEEQASYEDAERSGEFEPARRTLIVRTYDDYLPAVLPNALMFWNPKKGAAWHSCAYDRVIAVRSGRRTSLWGVSRRWSNYWRRRGDMAPDRAISAADRAFVRSIDGGAWARTAAALSEMTASAEEDRIFRPA